MPKVLACLSLTGLMCGGLVLTATTSRGQDSQEKQSTETKTDSKSTKKQDPAAAETKAESKPAKKDAPTTEGDAEKTNSEVAKETPHAPPTPTLAEVTIEKLAEFSEADAAALPAVEESIRAFVKDFNGHDAKTAVASFTPQAELIGQTGVVTRGTEAIQANFAKVFADQPTLKMHLVVQSLRFLSPELAVEEGLGIMSSGPEESPVFHQDRYTMTHVKHEGKWLIASARDWPNPPPTREEELKQLDWLVGDWVDENGDTLVATSYHWSDDKHYLLSDYAVHRQGQEPRKGTQRIGWDPRIQKLHSWNFDTAGGFTEGIWTRAGDQWIVKISGVSADGKTRSGTNILTRLSQDHASYQSRDRVLGGEVLPDLNEVPIVRKPPQPERAAK